MKLARAIYLDNADTRAFDKTARTGEWCLSGDFEFSPDRPVRNDLDAFKRGWLGLDSGGRVSLVTVSRIDRANIARLVERLAQRFVTHFDVGPVEMARPLAADELVKMADICAAHPIGTLLTLARSMTKDGIQEFHSVIQRKDILTQRTARDTVLAQSR